MLHHYDFWVVEAGNEARAEWQLASTIAAKRSEAKELIEREFLKIVQETEIGSIVVLETVISGNLGHTVATECVTLGLLTPNGRRINWAVDGDSYWQR